MKIIFSPSKEMDFSHPVQKIMEPSLTSLRIMNELRDVSPALLQKKLKISDDLLQEVQMYIANFDKTPCFPAILLYHGLAFRQFDPKSWSEQQKAYIQDHLLILSALYGPLHAYDLISPYRLDFNTSIKIDDQSLKSLWEPLYRETIPDGDVVVNLASQEFSSLFDKDQYKWVDVDFIKDGKRHSAHSKKGRGLLLSYMVEEGVESLDQLRQFKSGGFQINPSASTDQVLVFEA